jgi:predicted Zn finger-like uncharacterized protein
MQFSCESCKAQLQIADEKVRGRQLIVRCKRCGAKIALADPLLSKSPPRVVESAPRRPATDTDSTRAMDSDLLEKALQASKAEDGTVNGSPLTQRFAAPSPPVPANPAVWFAMLQGKQTGPLTRADLEVRANEGELGPRTYIWCEGMDSWQRAKDVLELAEMFPPLPAPPVRAPAVPSSSSAAAAQAGPGNPHRPPAEAASGPPAVAGGAAQVPPDEPRATPVRPTPVVQRVPMFEGAASTHGHGAGMVFLVVLSASAAAAVVLWIVLGSSPRKSEAPRPQARAGAQAASPAAIGLTADQVRRKLDEHKPALQDCVDDALRQDPTLRVGKIHVATTIAPSGQVTAARIDRENVDESPLGACLKRATREIVFPQFSGVAFDVDIPISVGSGD